MREILAEIDVRTLAPHERHTHIFGRFDGLQVGESFVIASDHNPVPLHMQLEGRTPGQVQWSYLQTGPDPWRVQIGKQAPSSKGHAAGSCCGACGGGG